MAMVQRPTEQHASATPAIQDTRERCITRPLSRQGCARLQPFENMQRQTPVRRHRPDFARAVFFSGNWRPPGRPDWRCNRAACADNVIAMTARKDFEAVAPDRKSVVTG